MRIAIFDAGHWHFPLYVPALRDPGIRLVGLSDREGFRGAEIAAQLGCPLLGHRELMGEDFDFALVLSRHSRMAAVAEELIARKCPFLIEKPCGLSSAEVARLDRLASAAGLFVTVPFILRVSELMQRLTVSETLSPAAYRYLSFRFIVGPIARYERIGCSWMLDQTAAGGGSAMNVGVHFYDLVAALTGSPIVRVSGQARQFRSDISVEELAAFTLETASGQSAHVHTGYLYPNTPEDQREFSFSIAHQDAYLQGHADEIVLKLSDGTGRCEKIQYDTDHFYPVFLRDALARCVEGRPPVAGLPEALAAVAVVEAGYRSAQRGGAPEPVVVGR